MIGKILIEIDGVDYEVPKVITVSHYGEIMRRFKLSETEEEKAMDIIVVLTGIPYGLVRQLDPDKLVDLYNYLQDKLMECDIDMVQTFKFKNVEYGHIVFPKMTFGEYIDLANFMKDENSIYTNIHKIMSVIYRPIVSKDKKIVIRNYNIDEFDEQQEIFKELPLKYFTGTFKSLYTYLTNIKKEFEVLFGDEEEQERKRNEDEDKKKKEDDNTNLSWYKMIMALANDDFSKIDYITSRPMVECFNHLTYMTIKNEEIKHEISKQQQKQLF